VVEEEEIEKIAKLMHIDIDNRKEYVEKVQEMIKYFDILDDANVEDEEITMPEKPLSSLRDDKHISFEDKLIEKLKHEHGTFVRAPKMD